MTEHTRDKIDLGPRKAISKRVMKRERAKSLISKIITEASVMNEEPDLWYDVAKVSVFGSYLGKKAVLGDLDIAVRTEPRWEPETNGFVRAWKEFEASNPPPASIARSELDRMHWPRLYVLKRFKSLGRGISIHDHDEMEVCKFDHKVIFERERAGPLLLK